MKRNLLMRAAFLAAAFLMTVSCVQESLEEQLDTPAGEFPASLFEKGHVRIYVEPALAEHLEAEGAGGPATKAVEGLGNVRMERTFPYAGKFEKRTREAGLDRWYDVWFDEQTPLTKASLSLEQVPGVKEVEYRPITVRAFDNHVQYVSSSPDAAPMAESLPFDDPQLNRQWHYYNPGTESGMAKGCDINVVPVWQDYTVGNPDVIVAVVDGGIDFEHEDLNANMWRDPERPGEVFGFNFMDNSVNILKTSHGTHVAGTIAAVNNNGKGVCGIAGGDYAAGKPGVKLMSCQIFKEDEDGGSRGASAIKWGADHGAVISQNSWGYTTLNYVPKSDIAAIDYFNTYAGFDENGFQVGPMAGGLVIFAAGNENTDFGAPGAYEGALAVASLGPDFYRAYYSNYGDWVNVAAPGGDYQKGHQILSTLPDNKYGAMQGTSMACPHVSGVAALIVSKCGGPGFTRSMLWNRIVNTTKDISSQNRNYPLGTGLVDVLAAITAEGSTPPEAVNDFKASALHADQVSFSLTVPRDEDDGKAYGINIYYSKRPISETTMVPYKSFPTEDLKAGDQMEGVLSGLEFKTNYYLVCEAYDRIGNKSALSNMVVVTTGPNHAPVITTNDELSFTLKAHETHILTFQYSDEDGHGVHSRLDGGSAADTLHQLIGFTQQAGIIGPRATAGTYTSTLHVFDDYEMETTLKYTYTILPNHAPVVRGKIDDMVFGSKGEVQSVDLKSLFEDADGEQLIYTTTSSDNDILNLHVREGVLYVTALKFGYASGTVTATDGLGASVSTSFNTLARDGSKPVDIYPTTVTDGKLYIRTATDQSIHVQVISETGTVVLEKSQNTTPFSPAVLDISNLGGGPYSVSVTFGSEVITQNIVKL
ncbi:MAG: S8 family serine peptidase [Bacteroidales bacterium]|nr:S8 family serine peptidase [Bacteroidales bacterium]